VNTTAANEFYQFGLNVGNEDNLPRGFDPQHQLDANFLQATLSAGKFFQLGLNDSLSVSANLEATRYDQLQGFDNHNIGFSADFGHKLGFGAYAPRLGVNLSARRQFFQGEARDSDLYGIELSYSRRISAGLMLAGGVDFNWSRTGDLPEDPRVTAFGYDPDTRLPYELFDYDARSLFLSGEYAFENGFLLGAGYRRVLGATVASTSVPTLKVYKFSDAFYSDPAFESEDWFGYLLDANTDEWSLSGSWALGMDSSLNLGVIWNDSAVPANRSYSNTIVTFGLLHNF
jgi:hypothetical protein